MTDCQRCLDLPACRAWADTRPTRAVSGVVAGEHREWEQQPRQRHSQTTGSVSHA